MANPASLKPFRKGKDERRNTSGRKPSALARLIELFPEYEGVQLSKTDAENIMSSLLSFSFDELERIANDKSAPAIVCVAARALVQAHKDGKVESLDKLLDRIHGKPVQEQRVTGTLHTTAEVGHMTAERLEQIRKLLRGNDGDDAPGTD